ncbi:hypothetical protein CDIK_3591 [Cucumispora dikerogammari]|nr:hypothetical protein CDIK_3591 [Cucumispora dikerogammari]
MNLKKTIEKFNVFFILNTIKSLEEYSIEAEIHHETDSSGNFVSFTREKNAHLKYSSIPITQYTPREVLFPLRTNEEKLDLNKIEVLDIPEESSIETDPLKTETNSESVFFPREAVSLKHFRDKQITGLGENHFYIFISILCIVFICLLISFWSFK